MASPTSRWSGSFRDANSGVCIECRLRSLGHRFRNSIFYRSSGKGFVEGIEHPLTSFSLNFGSLKTRAAIERGKASYSSEDSGHGDKRGREEGGSELGQKRKLVSRWRKIRSDIFKGRNLWKRIFFASKKVRSIIILNVLSVIYASDISVVKEVEAITDPALFTFVRFVGSAIPFIPFIVQARRDGRTCAAGMELGFWVSLGYLAQTIGLLTSDAGRASFLSSFTVIIVPFLDGLLGAKVPKLTWFGAVVSLIGIGLLESSGSPPNVGDLLNFMSAIFFGVHMLRTEHFSRTTKKEKYLALLGYEVAVVALFSMIWYFPRIGLFHLHQMDWTSWVWTGIWDKFLSFPWIPALYTGMFSTGLCLWAEMAAMRDISATETAIIYGLEPVWGAAFAWFLLDERWGATGWIGAVLILGGSLAVQLCPEKPIKEEEIDTLLESFDSLDGGRGMSPSKIYVSSRKKVTKFEE
ncbi:hypothetical protein AMTRI_Chr04g187760 [Amborella trichopoda]|uniref:EamA domain-containing protein n=1 Tax=Amborella trichopoda TaxID=13333 RepID=W1NTT7_AMBTC|nr:uncharacterized protein LOC18429067 [Amborella trichopoda]ERN00992.1 hypothetical protein AMTR_s00002p00110970 [Amborella trichopoda]|eukprot:XP_006838423.1 uncharacterized protein LOC18429067 [Amborella trichopoda]